MLYNELFYRHLYAHVTSFPELEESHQSYINYCDLFNALLSECDEYFAASIISEFCHG